MRLRLTMVKFSTTIADTTQCTIESTTDIVSEAVSANTLIAKPVRFGVQSGQAVCPWAIYKLQLATWKLVCFTSPSKRFRFNHQWSEELHPMEK